MPKKFIIVTLFLLASLTLVVSACVKRPQAPAGNQNPNVNANAATTTAEIDTSNWKTYRNEEYGFEFKYPGDWILSDLENGVSVKYSKEWNFGMQEGFAPFSIVIIKNSLQDFIKSYEGDFLDGVPLMRIISQESYTLDNKTSIELTGNNAEGINSYYIFVTYNERNYLISFYKHEVVQRAMLSVFHFLD